MTHGKILVVLPTLGDRLSTLEETLESIDEQRAQVNLQLVVILPASATEARKLAASQGACLVDDPRKGISHAINLGVETATDEQYYAWIGDDDLFRVGGLHTLRTLMEESPANVVAFGGCDYIDPAGRTIVTATFRHTLALHEIPASTLTDNAMVSLVRRRLGFLDSGA